MGELIVKGGEVTERRERVVAVCVVVENGRGKGMGENLDEVKTEQ